MYQTLLCILKIQQGTKETKILRHLKLTCLFFKCSFTRFFKLIDCILLEEFQIYRKIEPIIQSSHIPSHINTHIHSFTCCYMLHEYGTFATISELVFIHYYKLRSILYSHFLSFYLLFIFCSKSPSRIPCYFFLIPCYF